MKEIIVDKQKVYDLIDQHVFVWRSPPDLYNIGNWYFNDSRLLLQGGFSSSKVKINFENDSDAAIFVLTHL